MNNDVQEPNAKLDSISRLAAGVAHDFNHLFTAILDYSKLVLNRGRLDPLDTESLRHVIGSAQRAVDLTEQLRSFGRKGSPHIKAQALNDLILRSLDCLQPTLPANIDVLFEPSIPSPCVYVERIMLDQALGNLIWNGVEAMAPDGGQLRISTHRVQVDAKHVLNHPEARTGHFASIAVADTGCGMDAETLRQIFAPYFTTKGENPGRGLGLSKVAAVAKLFRGWVEASTQLGLGSIFTIYLPAGPEMAPVSIPTQAPTSFEVVGREAIRLVKSEATAGLTSRRLESETAGVAAHP